MSSKKAAQKKPATSSAPKGKAAKAKVDAAREKRLKKASSEVRNIACALTQEERVEKGDALSAAITAMDAILADRSKSNDEFRKKLKEQKKEVDRLSRIIGEKKEYRDVVVLLVESEDGRGMDIVRSDSRELVERRPFTPEERQRKLFADTEKATDKAIEKGFKAEKASKKVEAQAATTPAPAAPPAEEKKKDEPKDGEANG